MRSEAVILDEPGALSVRALNLVAPGADDVVVETRWSGISTGTEKLFWQGRMPWFPGHGYPLVPGYEGVGEVVEAGANAGVTVGTRVLVPGASCYEGARGLFGASHPMLSCPVLGSAKCQRRLALMLSCCRWLPQHTTRSLRHRMWVKRSSLVTVSSAV